MSRLMQMNQENKYTVDEVYDSLKILEKTSWFKKRLARQLIKINRLKSVELNLYVFRQIPIGMFFLLPIVALLLKLFHRKRLYILHVVHALHLHSFALMILGITWCILWLFHSENQVVIISTLIIAVLYSLLSFKRVYDHGWGKTIVKFLATGFLYQLILVISVVLLTVVALFFY